MQRPIGITILAVIAFLGGLVALMSGLALLGVATFYAEAPDQLQALGAFVAAFALGYATLSLIVAFGFWSLRSWAWPIGVALGVLGVVNALSQYAQSQSQLSGMIVSLAISLFIVWYLYQPHVKGAFGRS
jgi:uncharacterized membrane protein (DUF2068 family)